MFWVFFRSHIDTAKLLEGHLKENAIVNGAYVKWLVNHSGLKDVLDAQISVDKLNREVKYLKGDMVSQGDLRAVRDLEYSDKKLAYKALATKK